MEEVKAHNRHSFKKDEKLDMGRVMASENQELEATNALTKLHTVTGTGQAKPYGHAVVELMQVESWRKQKEPYNLEDGNLSQYQQRAARLRCPRTD